MPTAQQIADWIVHYSWNDLGAPVDPMSLEKLIYYAQCFHLVLKEEPLFRDEILAWQKGPVVAAVYSHYAQYGWNHIVPDEDEPIVKLPDEIAAFLKQIVGFFGRYTAVGLSGATHAEEPWREARTNIPPNRASGVVIPQLNLKLYYRGLMEDGEVALSRQEMLSLIPEPRWSSLYVAGICVHRMTSHPFYDAALANKLSERVQPAPFLSDEFYAPSRKREFVEFRDGDDVEAMLKRSH